MDDDVTVPATLSVAVFRVVATGLFVIMGAAFVVVGCLIAVGTARDDGGGCLLAVLGAGTAVVFGVPFVQSLTTWHSGLRLTADGFETSGRRWAWADVERFDVSDEEETAATHVEVVFTATARRGSAVRITAALGKAGYYVAPSFIPANAFDNGETPLVDFLREGLQRHRTRP